MPKTEPKTLEEKLAEARTPGDVGEAVVCHYIREINPLRDPRNQNPKGMFFYGVRADLEGFAQVVTANEGTVPEPARQALIDEIKYVPDAAVVVDNFTRDLRASLQNFRQRGT